MAGSILDQPIPGMPQAQPNEPTPRKSILDTPPGTPLQHQKILDAVDPAGKTLSQRMGEYIPKYSASILGPEGIAPGFDPTAQEFVTGAVKGMTLNTVDIGKRSRPETTGEALIQAAGSVAGSVLFPLGPAVKLAGKLGASKTAAGALINMASTEIETKFQASAKQLMLSGTFGALFGRFYGRTPSTSHVPVTETVAVPNVAIKMAEQKGPLLLEDMRTPVPKRFPDFYASEAKPGMFPYETTGLHGERILPTEYTPPRAPVVDVLTETRPYSVASVEGPGLFKEMGIKAKGGKKLTPGTTVQLLDKNAQAVLNKMKIHPDKDVRETGRAVDTFIKHSDDADVTGLVDKAKEAKDGILKPDGLRFRLWQDPHTIDRLPRSQLRTGITEGLLGSGLRPPKDVFSDVWEKTGGRIPGLKLFWDAATARQNARVQIGQEGVEIAKAVKGMSKATGEGVLQYFSTGDHNERVAVAMAHNLTPQDIAKGQAVYDRVANLWNRNFPDTPFSQYMEDILPRLRRSDPRDLEVLRHNKDVSYVEQWAANHEMNYNERDMVHWAASHVRALSMKEHFDPQFKILSKIADNKDGTYPPAFARYVGDWARNARGTASTFAENFNPHYKKMFQRLGVDPTDKDIRDVIDNYITLTHAGLVGFRAAPLLHNMFNAIQTGSRIGIPWLWKGMTRVMTKDGWDLARKAGMVEEASHEMEALRELAAPGRFTRVARNVADKGLWAYGKIDDYNRSAIFLGMHDRFLDAAKKAGNDRGKMLELSGLYRFHPAIRDQVLEKWAAKDVNGAAELAGVHAAQATQWVYRSEFRPTHLNGDMNRALGQFGVWPLNYMEYMRQMTTMSMPPKERAKWLIDFGLTNGSIVLGMGALGSSVGLGNTAMLNTLKWTFLGPMSYAGGPAMDLLTSLPRLVQDAQDIATRQITPAQSQTWNRTKSNLMNVIPGIGLQRDIARAKGPIEKQVKQFDPFIQKSESEAVAPSRNIQEEMFRIATGIGKKE